MKSKKSIILKLCFALVAVVISLNIALVYITAPTSNADETPVVVEDAEVVINTSGKVPHFDDAVECYMYAESKLVTQTCYSTITGYVKGSALGEVRVHQTMQNERIIDNNLYRYSTSKSEKQASLGKNNYQKVAFDHKTKDGLIYKMVTDKLNADGTPNYDNCKWETITQKEYEESTGGLPGTMMYLVRPSTVRITEIFEQDANGTYHLKLILNNRSAVVGYKKLVKQSAGSFATSFPAFKSVVVEAWIDVNGNFVRHIMDDTATISMGLSGLSIDCEMVSHYEEDFKIMGGNVEQPFEVPFIN